MHVTAQCEVSKYVEEAEAGVEDQGNLPAVTSRSCVAGITVSGCCKAQSAKMIFGVVHHVEAESTCQADIVLVIVSV